MTYSHDRSVVINFVGDVALFRHFEECDVDPLNDVSLPVADFSVCNFEFPLKFSGCAQYYDVSSEYGVSPDFARLLNFGRFDVYGLANNHVMDYGVEGMINTKKLLEDSGAKVVGVRGQSESVILEASGVRVAVIAAVKDGRWAKEGAGPVIIDRNALLSLVAFHKKDVDHVVLYLHWGTELVDAPDPNDVELARELVEAGASCVVGHHPHVPQGTELYGDGLISYSLGSFIYLSEYEFGNIDNNPIRDMSSCLRVTLGKDKVLDYQIFRYERDLKDESLIPSLVGSESSSYYSSLDKVVGDVKYYKRMVRNVLLKREVISFVNRFRLSPIRTLRMYSTYLKIDHIKKLIG